MPKPKVFIGSSQANLRVAELIADGLKDKDCAEVQLWNEGVFDVNEGFLETLTTKVREFDFAVLVFAPDDITESKGEAALSPRDNVLFEAGLFMGALGRRRVFIVHDDSVRIKIPSDFAGVSLFTYDGSSIKGAAAMGAVREACRLINDKVIEEPTSPELDLIGQWRSLYTITFDAGQPVFEDVEVTVCPEGIRILSQKNSALDYYTAEARFRDNQLSGAWRHRKGAGNASGMLLLTVNKKSTRMYGYFTSPDEDGKLLFGSWVLVKKKDSEGNDLADDVIQARLAEGHKRLLENTLRLPAQGAAGQ